MTDLETKFRAIQYFEVSNWHRVKGPQLANPAKLADDFVEVWKGSCKNIGIGDVGTVSFGIYKNRKHSSFIKNTVLYIFTEGFEVKIDFEDYEEAFDESRAENEREITIKNPIYTPPQHE